MATLKDGSWYQVFVQSIHPGEFFYNYEGKSINTAHNRVNNLIKIIDSYKAQGQTWGYWTPEGDMPVAFVEIRHVHSYTHKYTVCRREDIAPMEKPANNA